MPRFFGQFGHAIHEFYCRFKILENKRSADGLSRALPRWQLGEGGFDLGGGQLRHDALMPKKPRWVTEKSQAESSEVPELGALDG